MYHPEHGLVGSLPRPFEALWPWHGKNYRVRDKRGYPRYPFRVMVRHVPTIRFYLYAVGWSLEGLRALPQWRDERHDYA